MNYSYKSLDVLAHKVGGSLRLTALIISRARQITKKSAVYIDTDIDDPVEIAFMELIQDKIKLNDETK